MTLLQVRDLQVVFSPSARAGDAAGGGLAAVRGVGFEVAPGEVLGIVGESGSGKSTAALAVMGLLPRSARVTGSVRLRGEELLGRSDRELARLRGSEIGMVFQDPLAALNPVLTVGQQIAEAVHAHGGAGRQAARARGRAKARARAVELLELVGIPDPVRRARAYPHQLSGGMRQRVLIAMAIAAEPSVLIADEPTTALDVTVQAQVLEVLRDVRRVTGAAMVLITHDLGIVAGVADQVMIMRSGSVAETGSPDEIFHRPRSRHTVALLRALPRQGGRDRPAGALRPDGPVVLEVEGLVRHHPPAGRARSGRRPGAVRAVDGVSFDVRAGETLGLVGESGCGKTTLLMDILRLGTPQRGRVRLLGHDTAELSRARRKALRRELQVVFQDPFSSLDPRMTVGAIVAEPLAVHGWSRDRIHRRVPELLRMVGLESAHAGHRPAALSGGQRQRVGIARALALEPRLLVLDEAVSALDPTVRAGVLELLADLRAGLGVSYLFVAHDLAVVRSIADRVAVMYLGRIVEIGAAGHVYGAAAHPYTRALLSAVPVPDPRSERARRRIALPGEPPDPADPPPGCRFHPRCPLYVRLGDRERERCRSVEPRLRAGSAGELDHQIACHHLEGSRHGREPRRTGNDG